MSLTVRTKDTVKMCDQQYIQTFEKTLDLFTILKRTPGNNTTYNCRSKSK